MRWLLACVALLAASLVPASAVVNKVAGSRCDGTSCSTMMDLATRIFGADNDLRTVVMALVAALVLLALLCILTGWWGVFTGGRGGLERMSAGAGGLLVVIIVFGMVL